MQKVNVSGVEGKHGEQRANLVWGPKVAGKNKHKQGVRVNVRGAKSKRCFIIFYIIFYSYLFCYVIFSFVFICFYILWIGHKLYFYIF